MYVTVSGSAEFRNQVLEWLAYSGYLVKRRTKSAISRNVFVYVYFNTQKRTAGRCTKYSKIANLAIEHITEETAVRVFKLAQSNPNIYLQNKI